jgi:hypothetical protein
MWYVLEKRREKVLNLSERSPGLLRSTIGDVDEVRNVFRL